MTTTCETFSISPSVVFHETSFEIMFQDMVFVTSSYVCETSGWGIAMRCPELYGPEIRRNGDLRQVATRYRDCKHGSQRQGALDKGLQDTGSADGV